MSRQIFIVILLLAAIAVTGGCGRSKTVPHGEKWGIYELNLATQELNLMYSTPDEIYASALRLNGKGDKLVFARKMNGSGDTDTEICSLSTDGTNFTRLTENRFFDLYPAWSPDGTRIAFLSKRDQDLDLYVMDTSGINVQRLYDSGYNDADIDWSGGNIVFTSQFAIWRIDDNGLSPVQVTDPPNRGTWGKANLPAGDYDPRWSLDGKKIVFERLEDTDQVNGGYNIFSINVDGTGETRLTDNSCSQGLANWSHSGDRLVYIVAAINGQGKYDIYMMNSDGTDTRSITPDYFPDSFLCHSPIFSGDDTKIFFIGQWWE